MWSRTASHHHHSDASPTRQRMRHAVWCKPQDDSHNSNRWREDGVTTARCTITAQVGRAKTTPTAVRPRLRPLDYRDHDHNRNHINYRNHDRSEVAGDKAAAEGTWVGTAGDDGNGNAAGLATAEAAVLLDIFLLA
ncbi:hypothetical protein EDB86DRAFT_2827557 [Lactarius hatsudake]|nr:hypothetical protein EDB86DRAFT_2827557 [Lactarius hatsudake]